MLSVHIVLGLPRPLLPFILPSISNLIYTALFSIDRVKHANAGIDENLEVEAVVYLKKI